MRSTFRVPATTQVETNWETLELAAEVARIARAAGGAILEVYNQPEVRVARKTGTSRHVWADVCARELISAGLLDLDPHIPVLSDESRDTDYETRRAWSSLWLIDPLDGSREFITQSGDFTINIALIENGWPTLGVVYAPAHNVLYVGYQGGGAYKVKNGEMRPIRASGYERGVLKVVAGDVRNDQATERFLGLVGETERVNAGSTLKFCLVAEGSAHLYPLLTPTMEWDTAAAQCIVEYAGGEVTDLRGERMRYNKADLRNPAMIVTGAPAFPWHAYLNAGPDTSATPATAACSTS